MSDQTADQQNVQMLLRRTLASIAGTGAEASLPYANRVLELAESACVTLDGTAANDARARTLFALGTAMLNAGSPELAEPYLRECVELREQLYADSGDSKTKDDLADSCFQLGRVGDELSLFRSLRLREELAEELGDVESLTELADAYLQVSELGATMLYSSDVEAYLIRYLEVRAQLAQSLGNAAATRVFVATTSSVVMDRVRSSDNRVFIGRLLHRYLGLWTTVALGCGNEGEWRRLMSHVAGFANGPLLRDEHVRDCLLRWLRETCDGLAAGSASPQVEGALVRTLDYICDKAALWQGQNAVPELCAMQVRLLERGSNEENTGEAARAFADAIVKYGTRCRGGYIRHFMDTCMAMGEAYANGKGTVATAVALSNAFVALVPAMQEGLANDLIWTDLDVCARVARESGSELASRRLTEALVRCEGSVKGLVSFLNNIGNMTPYTKDTKARLDSFLGLRLQVASELGANKALVSFRSGSFPFVRTLLLRANDSQLSNYILYRYLVLCERLARACDSASAWSVLVADAARCVESRYACLLEDIAQGSQCFGGWCRAFCDELVDGTAPLSVAGEFARTLGALRGMAAEQGDATAERQLYEMRYRLCEHACVTLGTSESARSLGTALLETANRDALAHACMSLGRRCLDGSGPSILARVLSDACARATRVLDPGDANELSWMNLGLCERIATVEPGETARRRLDDALLVCERTTRSLVAANRQEQNPDVSALEKNADRYLALVRTSTQGSDGVVAAREYANRTAFMMEVLARDSLRHEFVGDFVCRYLQTRALMAFEASDDEVWAQFANDLFTLGNALLVRGDAAGIQQFVGWCEEFCARLTSEPHRTSALEPFLQKVGMLYDVAVPEENDAIAERLAVLRARLCGAVAREADSAKAAKVLIEALSPINMESRQDQFTAIVKEVVSAEQYDAIMRECSHIEPLFYRRLMKRESGDEDADSRTRTLRMACEELGKGSIYAVEPNDLYRLMELEFERGRNHWLPRKLTQADCEHTCESWKRCMAYGNLLAFSMSGTRESKSAYEECLKKIARCLIDVMHVRNETFHAAVAEVATVVLEDYELVVRDLDTRDAWLEYITILRELESLLSARTRWTNRSAGLTSGKAAVQADKQRKAALSRLRQYD